MAPSLNTILPHDIGNRAVPNRWQNVAALAATAAVLFVVWRLCIVVYRLTFHPLAKYPGPKLYAATNLVDLHRKYGPIVRVAPNHLAVDGSIGWPQIYQHRPGKAEWGKQPDFFFPGDNKSLIGGDHENHRRLRRQLNHAFSTESMYEQEPIVQQYIELLLTQLSKKAAAGEVFDIVPWFNFMTFDIIGDLTFADTFHNLDGGEYHPWVLGSFKAVLGAGINRFTKHYPLLRLAFKSLGSSAENVKTELQNRELANAKAMARKAQGESPGGRRDFMTYMLKKTRDGQPGFDDFDIRLNSPTIITAGSETTATTLAGFTFHLGLKANRPVYDLLAGEIRAAFQSESQIDIKSTARLPYLTATIEETLRMYPPAAQTPPRVSPGAELNGEHIPKGTVTTIFQLATYRNPDNFYDPDNMRPERWLPSNHKLYNPVFANDNKASFHPFSFGVRDCLGKNLAYSELRVAIARFLFRFDFELAPGEETWMDRSQVLVIWEKPPLMVKLTERKLVPVE
ncbi:hypothetical protein KVR01_010733 [Diaporthe batatas]|uniref:uncharacterized protein n=1 Tax=Diaporthe batatas TaxID=748121 RepID=UPI001D055305|nr:uncharacterized protein KVR01_010733 [Diaporthe batatas]KAG8159072.1 hypothetical protein KVR01_010733 [Diaporthe batatas]